MEQTQNNLPVPATYQPTPAEYQFPAYQPATPSYFSDLALFENGQRMAKLLAASDLVPQQFRGNIANTLIALEMANRTGSSPLAVMQSMYIVHGRPSWSATFIIASINASGRYSPLRFHMTGEGDDLTCRAYAVERETGERLESPPISIRTAKAEGWYGKQGSKWQTMPELMLRYRAATLFGRLYAADILMGMQTSEELADNGDAPARRESRPRNGKTMSAPAEPPAAPVIEGNGGPATVAEVNEMLHAVVETKQPAPKPPQVKGAKAEAEVTQASAATAQEPTPEPTPPPATDEEPPHPAETADAKAAPAPNHNQAMQKYLRMLEDVRGMSAELPGWPERQKTMEADLGGKDSEYYVAVMEYWMELMGELRAKMNGGTSNGKNGKR